MIYIGKDYSGIILSIVSAKSIESARAYWQGKGILPNTEEEFDITMDRENEESGYVTPILKTSVVTASKFDGMPQDFRIVVK